MHVLVWVLAKLYLQCSFHKLLQMEPMIQLSTCGCQTNLSSFLKASLSANIFLISMLIVFLIPIRFRHFEKNNINTGFQPKVEKKIFAGWQYYICVFYIDEQYLSPLLFVDTQFHYTYIISKSCITVTEVQRQSISQGYPNHPMCVLKFPFAQNLWLLLTYSFNYFLFFLLRLHSLTLLQ